MKPSAKLITDPKGTQYHIGCAKGDLAEYIVLVGDPKRAEKFSRRMDAIKVHREKREFVTYTGTYKNLSLSVMGTGMGHDNTEIAMVEISQITQNPTLIRCGSCSSLQLHAHIGEFAISKASLRLDATSDYYVPRGYPAVADVDVLLALVMASEKRRAKYHVGLTASPPGFYGAQGRDLPGFPLRKKNLISEYASMNILNMEMETGTLFALSNLRGLRAGAICGIFGNRAKDEFADEPTRRRIESESIDITLEALLLLKTMDEQKKSRHIPIWFPKEV